MFWESRLTTVTTLSIRPQIYPPLLQVVISTPRAQRREGNTLTPTAHVYSNLHEDFGEHSLQHHSSELLGAFILVPSALI